MPAQPLRFGSVLDLGCGTGLAARRSGRICDWLVGVDISPGMIEQARAKGVYDRLAVADLLEFLAGEAGAQHHLVLAADVFVYCSDLAPIAARCARVLAPGGLFAFTVETHDRPGVRLQETLRYAHGAAHVRAAIEGGGPAAAAAHRSRRPARKKASRCPDLMAVARNRCRANDLRRHLRGALKARTRNP